MQKYAANFLSLSWGSESFSPLKEFHLANGTTLTIVSEATRGIFAILSQEREHVELPPDRLIGLPQNNSHWQLKKFLEHTFVVVNTSRSGLSFCRFQQKGLGGFSHTIQYGPGGIIQNIEISESILRRTHTISGGSGDRSCSIYIPDSLFDISKHRMMGIFFQKEVSDKAFLKTNIYNIYPLVKIQVLKKDLYEAEIESISGRMPEIRARQHLLRNQKRETEQMLACREALMTSSRTDQERLVQLSIDRETMMTTAASISSVIAEKQSDLLILEAQREAQYGQIEALAQLIGLIDRLQITTLQSTHPALAQFRARTLAEHQTRRLDQPISNERLGKAVQALIQLDEESKSATGKHVIALMGATGAGKSTVVNHLLGIEFERDPSNNTIRVIPEQEPIATIGQNAISSETYKTTIYERVGMPFIFADCGGFLDTRGRESELTVVTSLKLTLTRAASLRVLLCFDTRNLEPLRGQNLKKALESLLRNFFMNYEHFGKAFAILFNRTVYHPAYGTPYTVEDLKQILRESEQELIEKCDPLAPLYTFALRDNGRHIYLYDPLSNESRESLHQAIDAMCPVETHEQEFLTPYSDGLISDYCSEMIDIANVANDIYSRISMLNDQLKELSLERSTLEAHLKQIEKQHENVSKQVQFILTELEQIPQELYSERIHQFQTELQMLSQEKKPLKGRFKDINTTELMTLRSWGSGWLVSDGKGFYDYQSFVDPLTTKHPDTAVSLDHIGSTLQNLGSYQNGLNYLMRALEMKREMNDPELEISLNNVGIAYLKLGNDDEALRYLHEAVERKAVKARDVSLAVSLSNLGCIYSHLKRFESALHYQEEADEILKTADGDHRSLKAKNLNSMGATLVEMGENDKAIVCLEEALSITKGLDLENSLSKRISEIPDVAVASIQINIGALKEKLGKHEEALAHQKQAVELIKERLGEHHPEFAEAMRNAALTLKELRRYEEALDYMNVAVKCFQNQLGDTHKFVIDGLIKISQILSDLGRNEESLQTELEILRLQKIIHGERNEYVSNRLMIMGMKFCKLERNEEALEHFIRSFVMSCEVFQNFHHLHHTCLQNIAVVLPHQTNTDLREKIRQEILPLAQEKLGPDRSSLRQHQIENPADLTFVTTLKCLGILYSVLNKQETALNFLKEAYEILQIINCHNSPSAMEILNFLGNALSSLGQYAEAEFHLRETVSVGRELKSREQPESLNDFDFEAQKLSIHRLYIASLNNLSTVLGKLEKNEESLVFAREAVDVFREFFGDNKIDYARLMRNVGFRLCLLGRFVEALDYLTPAAAVFDDCLGHHHLNVVNALREISEVRSGGPVRFNLESPLESGRHDRLTRE